MQQVKSMSSCWLRAGRCRLLRPPKEQQIFIICPLFVSGSGQNTSAPGLRGARCLNHRCIGSRCVACVRCRCVLRAERTPGAFHLCSGSAAALVQRRHAARLRVTSRDHRQVLSPLPCAVPWSTCQTRRPRLRLVRLCVGSSSVLSPCVVRPSPQRTQ